MIPEKDALIRERMADALLQRISKDQRKRRGLGLKLNRKQAVSRALPAGHALPGGDSRGT